MELKNDVKEIKTYISSNQFHEKPPSPAVSVVDDELFKSSLSAAFIKNAEVSRPWSAIGVDQWIESGRWWLLRSQMELYTVSTPKQKVPLAAYTNLIKASWILIDIIAGHPQVPFISASTHSEVQRLSAELKNEFSRLTALDLVTPDLNEIEGQDLRIWETQVRGPLLRPHKESHSVNGFTVAGGEQVVFQSFAICEMHVLTEATPCIVMFLVTQDARAARIVAQNQNGAVVMGVGFHKAVTARVADSCVTVNDELFYFTTAQDARFLGCLLEAARFFYSGRKKIHGSVEELKCYALLVAVKNRNRETVARLSQRTSIQQDHLENQPEFGLVFLAYSMASESIRGELNDPILLDFDHDRSQVSLFTWAVQCNHTALVKLLVSDEPTANSDDRHGMTPLGLASFCGHEAVARLLIHDEANVRARDGNKSVALHHAAFKGHERVVRLLLRSGAEVDVKDKDGMTPLHFSAREAHEAVVQVLIDRGANIDAKQNLGFTPLMEAASRGHEAVVAVLLEEGADACARSREGMRLMHFALEQEMSQTIVQTIIARTYNSRDGPKDTERRRDWIIGASDSVWEMRRDRIIVELDSDWGRLYLDSQYASIEMPSEVPSNVECAYKRLITITRAPNISAKFFKFTFEFDILHREETLDFSMGHGTLGTTRAGGSFRITIFGGGERVGRPTLSRGRNWQAFRGIELGESAPKA